MAAFRNASGITTLAAIAGAAMAAVSAAVRRKPVASRLHGSSRWATSGEIGKAGLLRDSGVVLCQTSDAAFDTHVDRAGRFRVKARKLGRLVRHDGPEHVLCFAPTGSGKGVGLVVPTLLSWPHSVLVYDIKKENWALTAGWRRKFSRVLRFEPTAMDSLRFNPLLEVRKGLSEVRPPLLWTDPPRERRAPGSSPRTRRFGRDRETLSAGSAAGMASSPLHRGDTDATGLVITRRIDRARAPWSGARSQAPRGE